MKVIELRSIETEGNANVMFIRIEIENLEQTLDCIMKILMDLSWLNYFDQEYLKESYKKRACETVNDIKEKFSKCDESKLTSDAGEYVVSVLAKKALTIEFNYVDIPLSELIGKKISGNPGFDFHSQNSNTDTIIFGEAKYVAKETAHMRALKQVSEFIEAEKDINSMYLKFMELDYKYGAYANFLSCGNYAIAVNCYNTTYRSFLIFYLRNLPMIVILKFGVTRIVSRSGEQLIFGCIK